MDRYVGLGSHRGGGSAPAYVKLLNWARAFSPCLLAGGGEAIARLDQSCEHHEIKASYIDLRVLARTPRFLSFS